MLPLVTSFSGGHSLIEGAAVDIAAAEDSEAPPVNTTCCFFNQKTREYYQNLLSFVNTLLFVGWMDGLIFVYEFGKIVIGKVQHFLFVSNLILSVWEEFRNKTFEQVSFFQRRRKKGHSVPYSLDSRNKCKVICRCFPLSDVVRTHYIKYRTSPNRSKSLSFDNIEYVHSGICSIEHFRSNLFYQSYYHQIKT